MFDCRSVLFRTLLSNIRKTSFGVLTGIVFLQSCEFSTGGVTGIRERACRMFLSLQKLGSMLCGAQRSRASRVVTNGFLLTCTSRDDLLVDDGRTSRNDRFFRYSAKITRPTLHIGSGFVQFVPVHPWRGKPGVWFDRFCFHLFRTRPHLSRGSRFFCAPG